MTCIGVYRWPDHVSCIGTTVIQTVQPACPRADTCGTEGALPSGAAASSVFGIGREKHLHARNAPCPFTHLGSLSNKRPFCSIGKVHRTPRPPVCRRRFIRSSDSADASHVGRKSWRDRLSSCQLDRTGDTDTQVRSIAKAISWRATGSFDTFVLAALITGNAKVASGVALAEIFTKIALYYVHERVWGLIPWGRR